MPSQPDASALAADLLAALDPAALCTKVGMVPDPWQLAVLRSTSRRICLVCARQAGKSWTSAVLAVWRAAYQPGSLVLMVAPALRQSQLLFFAALTLYRQLGRPVLSESENQTSLTLENGSRIVSVPGSEQTIRGFSAVDLLILDEASRIADEVLAAVTPMVAVSGGQILAESTPKGRRGWFYEISQNPRWEHYVVPATECTRISPAFLAEERADRGDFYFRQEYLCDFVDATGQYFPTEDIDAAFDAGEQVDMLPLFGGPALSLLSGGVA